MPEREEYPGAPRWVKALAATAILLILVFILLKLFGIGGDHGPMRHMRSAAPTETTQEVGGTSAGVRDDD